jgi:hypothetical protein
MTRSERLNRMLKKLGKAAANSPTAPTLIYLCRQVPCLGPLLGANRWAMPQIRKIIASTTRGRPKILFAVLPRIAKVMQQRPGSMTRLEEAILTSWDVAKRRHVESTHIDKESNDMISIARCIEVTNKRRGQ